MQIGRKKAQEAQEARKRRRVGMNRNRMIEAPIWAALLVVIASCSLASIITRLVSLPVLLGGVTLAAVAAWIALKRIIARVVAQEWSDAANVLDRAETSWRVLWLAPDARANVRLCRIELSVAPQIRLDDRSQDWDPLHLGVATHCDGACDPAIRPSPGDIARDAEFRFGPYDMDEEPGTSLVRVTLHQGADARLVFDRDQGYALNSAVSGPAVVELTVEVASGVQAFVVTYLDLTHVAHIALSSGAIDKPCALSAHPMQDTTDSSG